ncbi:hypothetical protein Tco_0421438 [Tanacetum coccineum]
MPAPMGCRCASRDLVDLWLVSSTWSVSCGSCSMDWFVARAGFCSSLLFHMVSNLNIKGSPDLGFIVVPSWVIAVIGITLVILWKLVDRFIGWFMLMFFDPSLGLGVVVKIVVADHVTWLVYQKLAAKASLEDAAE